MAGPYTVDNMGDWIYVVDAAGDRVAECQTLEKANMVCAALNMAHYCSVAMGSA